MMMEAALGLKQPQTWRIHKQKSVIPYQPAIISHRHLACFFFFDISMFAMDAGRLWLWHKLGISPQILFTLW